MCVFVSLSACQLPPRMTLDDEDFVAFTFAIVPVVGLIGLTSAGAAGEGAGKCPFVHTQSMLCMAVYVCVCMSY